MPRQRSGARPSAAPARRPAPTQQQQTRPATTYAAPPPASQAAHSSTPTAQAPTGQAPGLFAQMATTAAGVAVGSAVGHTLSSAVGGLFGGSSAPADAAPQAAAPQDTNNSSWGNNCAGATQNFTKCMDDNSGNMNICGWYLEQLKACQSAASQY
ncbi:mitochondrial intermembrane space cysteine motif-containing protein MIX17 [Podospora conica]|nr:mitochondrial intermembrane space cysteine motif-containing protein MIX17 [Schizothecium conicum]